MVEFALILPLLVLLLFGVIEFGNTYSQVLDVRHAAREGSRLAAVNYNPSAQTGQTLANTTAQAICDRMDNGSGATVQLSVDPGAYPTDATVPGRYLTVEVSAPVNQITGMFESVLDGVTLKSSVRSRIEQQILWTDSSSGFAAPSPYTCP